MKATATKDGVTLRLTVEEAIALEAILGGMTGQLARELPWYDQIANVLEAKHLPTTISHAVEQRFNWFCVDPTYYNERDERVTNERNRIRKAV